MKKITLENIIPLLVVIVLFGFGFSAKTEVHATTEDPYVTSKTTSVTKSCVWKYRDLYICSYKRGKKVPQFFCSSGCSSSRSAPKGACGLYIKNGFGYNTCGGSYCTNKKSNLKDYTKTIKSTTYTCHYISKVTGWSECSEGVQVATGVEWSTKSGKSCSNIPTIKSCSTNNLFEGIIEGTTPVSIPTEIDPSKTDPGETPSPTISIEGSCGTPESRNYASCGGFYSGEESNLCKKTPEDVSKRSPSGNTDGCEWTCKGVGLGTASNCVMDLVYCGDGVCEKVEGENFVNCPADCESTIIEF